jgi:hypothetical protein
MVDVINELLSYGEAARLIGPNVSPASIFRWSTRGLLSSSGQRVVLKTVRIGRGRCTTRSFLNEFLLMTADIDSLVAPPTDHCNPPDFPFQPGIAMMTKRPISCSG